MALIRRAEATDVPGIIDAHLLSWRAGYQGLLPGDVLEREVENRRGHGWLDGILSGSSEVLVADDAGIVGVVQAVEAPGAERDQPEILMLYVIPEAWGSDVASSLLSAATAWIRTRGHRTARLRVVAEQDRARRFYEREGWTVDDEIPPTHNGLFPLIYYHRPV